MFIQFQMFQEQKKVKHVVLGLIFQQNQHSPVVSVQLTCADIEAT